MEDQNEISPAHDNQLHTQSTLPQLLIIFIAHIKKGIHVAKMRYEFSQK